MQPDFFSPPGAGNPFTLQVGDLVVSRAAGEPSVFEVVEVACEAGRVRVRGLAWPPGYSVLVAAGDLRPVNPHHSPS